LLAIKEYKYIVIWLETTILKITTGQKPTILSVKFIIAQVSRPHSTSHYCITYKIFSVEQKYLNQLIAITIIKYSISERNFLRININVVLCKELVTFVREVKQ